jgi:DNA-binding response OmpR family regulator
MHGALGENGPRPHRRAAAAMNEVPTQEQRSALVVEDDEHIGQLLKFILEHGGWQVVLATDGRQAETCIRSGPVPSVALFDVMLPYLDGLQLVTLARQQPGWERVPVLMLTAKAQERDIARALAAGATDYMVKPFQPAALLERLRTL